jgi:hypothetical protein
MGNYMRDTRLSMREMFTGCFLGCELVDLLLDREIAWTQQEAVRMGQELVHRRMILPLQVTRDEEPEGREGEGEGGESEGENSVREVSGRSISGRSRKRRKHTSIKKKDALMGLEVRFKDDNSLYRPNSQGSQVTEWLLESGTSKLKIEQLQHEEREQQIGVLLTGTSFGVFSTHNRFRQLCARVVSHWYFEALVMGMIFISRWVIRSLGSYMFCVFVS